MTISQLTERCWCHDRMVVVCETRQFVGPIVQGCIGGGFVGVVLGTGVFAIQKFLEWGLQ